MRKKLEMDILRMNGYDNLSADMKKKFDSYSSAAAGVKISSVLEYSDFCNIISSTTFLFRLRYQNVVYDIDRYVDGTYDLFSDGGDGVLAFNIRFKSLEEFVERAQINGHSLCELWNELLID